MWDVIIVGSGAAGTAAARALRGLRTLVLDVGIRPPESPSLEGNLYELRKQRALFAETIGARFESLADLDTELSPKVRPPLMRYVIERPAPAPGVTSATFRPLSSHAEGGLANAWGAQVYRFDDGDLRGFPLRAAELAPHYDDLTAHLGISGADDDLTPFHGPPAGLLPPLALSALGRGLLERYRRCAGAFRRDGIAIGRPRLAVLSVEHEGRAPCAYDNLEFFQPRLPAVYTPAFTLRAMVERGEVEYRPGVLVEGYAESHAEVRVLARPLAGGAVETVRGRKLLLCLGALNTARLVLLARKDFESRLPLLENPCSYTPLLDPRQVGMPLERRSFYAQLNLFYSGPLWDEPLVAMIYGADAMARADLLFRFPLTARGCLAAARWLLPAMLILQLYYPEDPRPGNTLRVERDGTLALDYAPRRPGVVEPHLVRALRRAGVLGSARLTRYAGPGGSVHYAGALPMRERPAHPYETDRNGRLHGSRRVHVGDAATFPRLPAKNLTLTIMANAMRIATAIRRELGGDG